MMRKFYSRLIVVFALMLIGITGAWAQTQSKRTSEFLPRVVDFELQPGKMYIVQPAADAVVEDGKKVVTLDASVTAGKLNGLRVAKATYTPEKQAPILFIPADVKLVVKGANANGMNGAGAGIYVPTGAELIITGAGQLVATGGKAGNGEDGEDGHNPKDVPYGTKVRDFAYWVDVLEKSGDMEYSGRGGNGGNGGGGAGAGIGGIGGAGGVGGAGGAAVHFQDAGESSSSRKDGKPGAKGGNGSNGAAMGKVSIMGTVTVTATAGAAADHSGTGGQQGFSFWHRTQGTLIFTAHNIAGGGGAGAGGGAGYEATYGIGGGGAGAGAGGGGGSGAVDWREILGNTIAGVDYNSCRAASGIGGTGSIVGANGQQERARDAGDVSGNFTKVGGTGGAAGTAGTKGNGGYLYVGTDATVNGQKGGNEHTNPTGYEGSKGVEPNDMNINLTFKNNEFDTDGNPVAEVQTVGSVVPAVIGDPLPALTESTYKLTATSKYFAGYYTNDKGLGNRMYKGTVTAGNLVAVASAVPFAQSTDLFAHFSHNQHRVNWDYSYVSAVEGTLTVLQSSEYLKYGKLVFYFRDGTSAERILDVSSAETFEVPDEQQYPLRKHTIASGEITLSGDGNGTETKVAWTKIGTGNEATFSIHLTDAQLAQFVSYKFEPMTSETTLASSTQWITTTNADGHVTTFSFIGGTLTQSFPLQWTVTLTGLAEFPAKIYAQPLYKNPSDQWAVISQTAHTLGVECSKTGEEDGRATYTFSYPVWKQDNQATPQDYQYRLGLTGFRMNNGQTFYLNTPHETPHEHYESSMYDIVTYTTYTNLTNDRIEMTLGRTDIPVLRLDVNDPTHTATLDNGQPYLVVTSYGGNISAPNTAFKASRAGYTFNGWADHQDGTVDYPHDYNAELTGYTETRTIYAQWVNAIAPAITTQGISYYDNEGVTGAMISVAVHGANGSTITTVQYIVNDSPAEPGDWSAATDATADPETGLYNLNIQNKSKGYLHIKATDDGSLSTVVNSPELKLDGFAPQYTIYPTGNVCNFVSKITLTDNVALDKVYVKVSDAAEYTEVVTGDTRGITIDKTDAKNWVVNIPIPADDAGITYSFYAVDAAANQTEPYENFVTMYHDHAWDTGHSHEGMIYNNETKQYEKVTYYNCLHQCGHIWIEDYKVGDTTFGNPSDDASGTKPGYSHTSTLTTKTDAEKLYQEQGLMRDATNNFLEGYGTVVISNAAGDIVGFDHGINNAISDLSSEADGTYTFTLLDNTNVEWSGSAATGTSVISATTINKPVVIDLNGHGLLVNGSATGETAITGASGTDVTILLKDDGATDYANGSKVTGLPIKYVRDFATTARQGKWQALYLPFDAAISDFSGYTVGKPKEVEITETTASLSINKTVSEDDLVAFKHLFIKSSDGKIEITKTTELKPYDHADSHKQTVSEHYTFDGSLKASDNVAGQETKSYWVLTNGGAFSWAKKDSHQRPYHWVIYYTPAAGGEEARPTTLSIVETEDDPTAIRDITVDEAEQAEAAIYSLSGQRMPAGATLPSGIYVRNGKKIYVK